MGEEGGRAETEVQQGPLAVKHKGESHYQGWGRVYLLRDIIINDQAIDKIYTMDQPLNPTAMIQIPFNYPFQTPPPPSDGSDK